MADMLKSAVEYLRDTIAAEVSRSVTYRRGAASVTIDATLGKKLLKLGDDLGGLRMAHAERDYVIPAEDLILSGSLTTPAKGDQIVDAGDDDGVVRVWEVLSPGGDEAVWQWVDPYQVLARVFCKFVDTE